MKTIVFILSLIGISSAANILVMLPKPLYSHTTNYMAVFKELAKRGHNMTVVSPYPQKEKIPNWTDIPVRNTLEEIMAQANPNKDQDFSDQNGWFFNFFGMWLMFPLFTEKLLNEEPVQRVIKDTTSSYDLIITEVFFAHEPYVALGHKFNAPIVAISAAGIHPVITSYTGNHFPTSYLPNYKNPMSDKMSFFQRVENTFLYMWEIVGTEIYYMPLMDNLMRKYIVYPGSESLPPIKDMIKNISLVLVESHLGLHYPRPLHNNLVEIGGINLKDGAKLPADLQSYMDNAPDGVIYFSLGSHFKAATLKSNISTAIISAFGKVKQKVLMKWEHEAMPNQPKNLKFVKWLPQASILGHPNCKVFVTHGGLHGVTEGLYNGVPMVGLPVFADQMFNIKFVESTGAGIGLELKTIKEDALLDAINKVLSDSSYKENAMIRKAILRDNPISPVDKAAYWVEYVLRHKGAPHLRPASVDICWLKYYLVDVMLFLAFCLFCAIAVLIFGVLLVFKCLRLICRAAFGSKDIQKSKNLKKKNN